MRNTRPCAQALMRAYGADVIAEVVSTYGNTETVVQAERRRIANMLIRRAKVLSGADPDVAQFAREMAREVEAGEDL